MYIQVSTGWKMFTFKVSQLSSKFMQSKERGKEKLPSQIKFMISGKVKRFGKNGIKFIKKGKEGSIICVGEDLGYCVIIKTIERGN